jgi:hypothetical protein
MWARQQEAEEVQRRARELAADPYVDGKAAKAPLPAE